MSMVRCDECDGLIDSDDDPDCFISYADQELIRENYGDVALCHWCRGKDPLPTTEAQLTDLVARLTHDAFTATSELIKLRCDPEAARFVAAEEVMLWEILNKLQLLVSEIRTVPRLRVVR